MSSNSAFQKIPAITAVFWILKITATTLGETGGDWLSMTMGLGYLASTLVFFGLFVLALGTQLAMTSYRPYVFWSVIIATSTAGTTLSDYMDRTLNLGYARGVGLLVTLLLIILGLWRWSLGTVAVSHIRSRKAELFYWLTILVSNTLGTALGDFLADESGLGFLGSWLLISSVLLLLLILHFTTKLSSVLIFWLAFILTRPFGATFGDVLTKEVDNGGFAFGRGTASLILLAILLLTLVWSQRRGQLAAEQVK